MPTALSVDFSGVTVASPPRVNFTLKDQSGAPYIGMNKAMVRFGIAKLVPGTSGDASAWQNYINREESKDAGEPGTTPDGTKTIQGTTETATDGTWVDNGDGSYSYTFKTDITNVTTPTPVSYDATLTHRLAVQISGGGYPVANGTFDFRPDGGTVTTTRKIVQISSCNECHGQLAMHGGGRIDTNYCVVCHNPGSTDANSGNTLDFKVMVHKIHYGLELPSTNVTTVNGKHVLNGTPYRIWGFNNSEHDYSYVGFPADVRSGTCTKCHNPADTGTPNAENWSKVPNRQACGSCHDDVNFDTGLNHPGGPQPTNAACSACHNQAALANYHNPLGYPTPSAAPDYNVEITLSPPTNGQFYDNVAGETPVVTIVAKNAGTGTPIDHTTINQDTGYNAAQFFVHGPRDKRSPVLTTAAPLTAGGSQPRPTTGSYAANDLRNRTAPAVNDPRATRNVGNVTYQLGSTAGLKPGTYIAFVSMRPTSTSTRSVALVHFQVGTATEQAKIATNCTTCHEDFKMHGAYPINPDYCGNCHDYYAQQVATWPGGGPDPGSTGWKGTGTNNKGFGASPIARRVHGVHKGSELVYPSQVHNSYDYQHVTFPQDVRNCATTCHTESDTWKQKPNRLACNGCHDSDAATAHTSIMTIDPTNTDPYSGDEQESCATCHGAGRDKAPDVVHQH
ncbi:MAG: OmcA/MtrC family decaheme c-type cytochrome [Armatimonadetes bacterium]|nr:OmcA/MtrC family decaheme c-type cytochrome [Armatimonadota bacterium]